MTHEEFLDLIPDLLGERLPAAVKKEADTHAAACAECAEALRALLVIRHPGSKAIVEYALGDSKMAAESLERIEHHVGHCGACREEVDVILEASRIAEKTSHVGRRMSSRIPLAVAAALAGVLIYPAYLGLVRLPAAERSVKELRRVEAGSGAGIGTSALSRSLEGIARMTLLRSATRSGEEIPLVRVGDATQVVPLGVEIILPPDVAADDHIVFELQARGEMQAPVWAAEASVEEGISALRREGMMLLLVPSARLRGVGAEVQMAVFLVGETRRELARLPFRIESAP